MEKRPNTITGSTMHTIRAMERNFSNEDAGIISQSEPLLRSVRWP